MPTTSERTAKLKGFIDWSAKHIKGYERGEAQVFLDRLFQAFGWEGLKEAGAECELRVKNTNGGTSFADLVWKPIVVIEMKKRGADLGKHYSQAFEYWTRLVPNRPRYAILCNFDSFWIYDFETQIDTPVDKVNLDQLAAKYGPLNFMFPGDVAPIFGNHQESVTRQAADKLASCFTSMSQRGVERPLAQRFTLQMLMALFSEDIGLLERYLVTRLLDDCKKDQDTHDLLGGLFAAMNTKGGVSGGRFKGVPYFNGGLFANPAFVELNAYECSLLKEAAQFDWSKVRPEIFGTLFEHSLGKKERHATGAHFTNAVDIMKVVGPTIVAPWTSLIESADTLGRLRELLIRIENFKVLDPACGSGNFLYIAYRELKRLEARIYERMASEYKSVDPNQRPFGFVSTRNFFGIDINPFAIAIAKVTMVLAHKLSIDELHISESALPLDNLDDNFRAGDALIDKDGTQAKWFKADVIIGNPPFLGSKLLKPTLGAEYVRTLRKAYPHVPGMADFCVFWIRRTQDELKPCTFSDPVAGRAGLVGTQNIRNNESRVGGLDYVAMSGTIIDAVENQPWSGEANVHVSIANWVNSKDLRIIPKMRRLWSTIHVSQAKKKRARRGAGPLSKSYELDRREVSQINSALSDRVDVSKALSLESNSNVIVCQGITPGHSGFVLSADERAVMTISNKKNLEVIHPYMVGDDILGAGKTTRSLIDFETRSILEAQSFVLPFDRLTTTALPDLERSAKDESSERSTSIGSWWLHWRPRRELIQAIALLPRYLACSRITKRPLFSFICSSVRPGDALQAFALDDDYSFGVLQSHVHYHWFHSKCSNMKSDPRYTSESVFQTFPWPQSPSDKNVDEIACAARKIRNVRSDAYERHGTNMRKLYRTLDLPGKNPLREAHSELDRAVLRAFGFSEKQDVLQQLLDLNQVVSLLERDGEPTNGAGIPASYKDPGHLLSPDCIGI